MDIKEIKWTIMPINLPCLFCADKTATHIFAKNEEGAVTKGTICNQCAESGEMGINNKLNAAVESHRRLAKIRERWNQK